jgi:hypothetical protein
MPPAYPAVRAFYHRCAAMSARFRRMPPPILDQWRDCRAASGWDKVEAVRRLAAVDDLPHEVRGWLLRHGCEDVVMPEFVAHACATAGRLEDELRGLVDDALLDGACVILSALVNGGPVEDIDDYEPGPRTATMALDLLADRAPNVVRMRAAADLLVWAEDYEQHVAIAERCGRLLGWEEARRYVAARIERREELLRLWSAAEAMGLDAWEAGWRLLGDHPHDPALHHQLARTRRRERRARLIAFAERALPLEQLASGPEDRRLPGPEHRDAALTLDSLVQRLRPSLWSVPLVAAALLSPVTSTRSGALAAVAGTDPGAWGAPVEASLRRLAAEEPDGALRDRAVAQLARLGGA